MKTTLYAIIVICFIAAGIKDLADGQTKLGVVAIAFGILNGIIFFWRA